MNYRVFLSLNISASSGFDDGVWKSIFFDTFKSIGLDVYLFTYKQALDISKSKSPSRISEIILDVFKKENKKKRFDIFFTYYNQNQVSEQLFSSLKGKILTVNYTTNFHQIGLYDKIIREVDCSIYASIDASQYFKENAQNSYYMPFAALKKYSKYKQFKKNKISFIGTSYGNRPIYIWRCLQHKLPINIYGYGWKKPHKNKSILRSINLLRTLLIESSNRFNQSYRLLNEIVLSDIYKNFSENLYGPLSDSDYFNLLSNSQIILNFPESRYNHDYNNPNVLMGANLRDFEVPNSGSCLFTQRNDEILTFFEDEVDIVTFSNEWEMIDKLNFYKEKEEKLSKIALNGHKKVISENLWDNRFVEFFKYLKLNYL